MKKRLDVGLILHKLLELKTDQEKIAWLQEHKGFAVFYMLWVALSPKVTWNLPPGLPPYLPYAGRPNAEPMTLESEIKRLYLFLRGPMPPGEIAPEYTQIRLEKKFQLLIENVPSYEVEIIAAMKDGHFEDKYVSMAVVSAAFPGFFEDQGFTIRYRQHR